MYKVTNDQAVSVYNSNYSAEASTLGLKQLPKALDYRGLVFDSPKALRDAEGELYGVEYTNCFATTFTVWND